MSQIGKRALICGNCGAVNSSPAFMTIPEGARADFPLGPNGGVLVSRRVPGTDDWIEIEHSPPNDERDDYVVIQPLIPLTIAAIVLNVTPKRLYARAPYMASARKIGGRWHFITELLYGSDLSGEAPLPSRAEELADREMRRSSGEILRPGRHANGCPRVHEGPCRASMRKPPPARARPGRGTRNRTRK